MLPLENNFWYFKSALSSKFCDEVVKYALSKPEMMGITGIRDKKNLSKKEIWEIKRKRNSDVIWLDDPWIMKEIQPFVHIANVNAGWNFKWDASESCQFTKYKINQFYDWHIDTFKPLKNNRQRKISMTCQLTDGSEYEGGELQFDFRDYSPNLRDESNHLVTVKEILPKGTIVVFPSFLWHRVQPVTKGTRYSLVMWNLGESFK
jgi:PKHD-type hydroxylase